ncbi:MAG: DUF4340 domain-containing protein [Phycisphaeraceae bacterium]|nr:DUF4340 domain-containing protein [Phycisphaeraceae bacterium]
MNFKTTLFLLVLLAIVGVFFLWDKDHPGVDPNENTAEPTEQRLLDAAGFDKDKIASLTIEKEGKTSIITKVGSDWEQILPVKFKLNTWSASQAGERALALSYTEKLTPGKKGTPSLADVNLDTPLATVTVTFNDDTPQQVFKLGRKGVGGRGYLMLNDDAQVYVVGDDLHQTILDQTLSEWRSKSLTAPAQGQINQITKVDGNGTIQVVKKDSKWTLAGDHTGRVSQDKVTELLNAINGIYIAKFVADKPDDLSLYGLDKPAMTLTMQLPVVDVADALEKTFSQQTLMIGSPVDLEKERYFATFSDGPGVGDVVFEMSQADFEKFDKNVDALREDRITPLVADDVTKVLIAHGKDTKLQLVKAPQGWGYGDPKPGYGLDQELTKTLLDAIIDAKAVSYVQSLDVAGDPLLTVILSATGYASDEMLKVYSGEAGHYTVIRNNETVGYNVAQDQLKQVVDCQVALLRNRTISEMTPSELKHVDMTLPDGTQLQLSRNDAAWELKGYDKHESIALAELLDALAPLKADSWQTTGPVGDRGYLITYGNDDQTLTLKVDPNTHTAVLKPVGLSFRISETLLDKLKAELRPRTIVDVRRDMIQKVQIISKAQQLIIEQKEGKFTLANAVLDEAKAGALFDTLAGLRVERYTKPKKISRPIEVIVTTANQTFRLELSDNHTGQIDSTYFMLSEDDFQNLTAKLTK